MILLFTSAAFALDIDIQALVAPDLRTVSGTMRLSEAVALVDPLTVLPAPPDDRTLFRTFPGAPETGSVRWTVEGDHLTFTAQLPRRYGEIGVLPGRGMWADGGWYPQPLGAGGEAPTVAWHVAIELPPGVLGVLNGKVGEGSLDWTGTADRAALAVLEDARITTLPVRDGEVRLVEHRRPEPAVAKQVVLAVDEGWPLATPPDLTIVEDLDLLRLARAAPGMVYLSDRAFRLTPGLRAYHRGALRREVAGAALQTLPAFADGWVRDFGGGALTDALPAPSVRKLLGWFSWNPLVDALLYDGTLPYFADTFDEPAGGPAGVFETLGARIPGRMAALQLDDLHGKGTAAEATRRMLAGATFEDAVTDPDRVAAWRQRYVRDQDYAVSVGPSGTSITRRAPADAPSEVVVVKVGDDAQPAWVTGPGSATLPISPGREPVRVDPDGHVLETALANDRWPETWTVVVNGGLYNLTPTQHTFDLEGELYFRRRNDNRNLFVLGASHSAQDLAALDLGYVLYLGPLKDRRTRTHRFTFFFGPALLDPAFRPTEAGAFAVGGAFGYAWDTRMDDFFALSGHRRTVSLGGGFVPGSEERWGSASVSDAELFSPHPRHVIAVRGKAGWASGDVEHRLLPLGGPENVRGVPESTVVANERLVGTIEYRFAPMRNASIPLAGLLWLSELQLSPGVDAGVAWRDAELSAAVSGSLGVHVITELFGAKPSLSGVTLATPLWTNGLDVDPVQLYIDFSHPF